MADFTEEILKREIKNGEQMVEQLTGIKKALSSSGSGGGGPLLVEVVQDGNFYRTDKTAGEIETAFYAGSTIWFDFEGVWLPMAQFYKMDGAYTVKLHISGNSFDKFEASSDNEYMVYASGMG